MRQHAFFYRHTVDKGAVAAVQILEADARAFATQHAMPARDQRVQQRDLVGGIAPDRNLTLFEREGPAFGGPADRFQANPGRRLLLRIGDACQA